MILMATSVIIVDYASQAGINPSESLLADLLHSSPNLSTGYVVYSNMLSIGCCFGYLLSSTDWSFVFEWIGAQEKAALVITLTLYIPLLLLTLISAKETSSRHWELTSGGLDDSRESGISSDNEDLIEPRIETVIKVRK